MCWNSISVSKYPAGTLPAPALPTLIWGEEPAVVGLQIRLRVPAPLCGNGWWIFVGLHHCMFVSLPCSLPLPKATPKEWAEQWTNLSFLVWRHQGQIHFVRDQVHHNLVAKYKIQFSGEHSSAGLMIWLNYLGDIFPPWFYEILGFIWGHNSSLSVGTSQHLSSMFCSPSANKMTHNLINIWISGWSMRHDMWHSLCLSSWYLRAFCYSSHVLSILFLSYVNV